MSNVPNTIEELAKDLLEIDATMADAQIDNADVLYPSWDKSSEDRKNFWLTKANAAVDSGEFILGKGYKDEG